MKIIIVIALSLFMNNLFGQSEKNNSFEEYEFEIIFWLDSINVKQKQYYPNKIIKLEYEVINDSIKIRKEYFESGNIKLEAEVYQRFKKSIKTSPKESNNGYCPEKVCMKNK